MLDNIPKLKKSGRCVLHSMEGVRCRPGGRSWREVWDVMDTSCRESVTLVCPDQLLATLDNYLRKHRFCQECKNKVCAHACICVFIYLSLFITSMNLFNMFSNLRIILLHLPDLLCLANPCYQDIITDKHHLLSSPKVHRAFDILVGGQGSSTSSSNSSSSSGGSGGGSGTMEAGAGNKDKGYVAALYAGIRRCEEKRHIHIPADTDYVTHLITRAEPELQGRCVPVWICVFVFYFVCSMVILSLPFLFMKPSPKLMKNGSMIDSFQSVFIDTPFYFHSSHRRERHAKTLEIAQEEVLTCLGLFLYERLQKVHTRLREEEQTWDILFHVALDTLRRNFEVSEAG